MNDSISPNRSFTNQVIRYQYLQDNRSVVDVTKEEFDARLGVTNNPKRDPTRYSRCCYKLNLHWSLDEQVWERHQLSNRDIDEFLRKAEPLDLWLKALQKNHQITTSACKPNYSSKDGIVAHGKTVILKKLYEKVLQQRTSCTYPDKLVCANDQHIPHLPVHKITNEECRAILQKFPKISHTYAQTLDWRGIHVVPYCLYKGFLQMLRVVPKEEYYAIFGPPTCLRVTPMHFTINGIEYCDMDETFLFWSEDQAQTTIEMPYALVPKNINLSYRFKQKGTAAKKRRKAQDSANKTST